MVFCRKNSFFRIISFFLILLTVFFVFPICITAKESKTEKIDIEAIINDIGAYVYSEVKNPTIASVGGEWAIIGLSRSDLNIPAEYFETYYSVVEKYIKENSGILHKRKYTEYSRVILALTAIGKNPEDVGGYNLLEPLGDFEKTIWQGINGPIWALIAADCGMYEIPINKSAVTQATKEMYVNYILEKQNSDGGWSLSGDESDVDITGMALQALSKYQNRVDVKTAVEKALLCMSGKQNENGGFSSWETENTESSVQMIVALCELGISLDDSRFVKNDKTILDALLSFYSKGKGFSHEASENITNQMSTEQGLYALVALDRFINCKNSLYDMSDVNKRSDDASGDVCSDITKSKIIYNDKTFDDIQGNSKKKEIEALARRGIINGVSETAFSPGKTMTRAEFATIISGSLGLPQKNNNKFIDVSEKDWFFDSVNTASDYGIIKGVSETSFNPYETITMEEVCVMICRAAKLCGIDTETSEEDSKEVLSKFYSISDFSDWSVASFAFCVNNGIIHEDNYNLLPYATSSRDIVASMVYNLLSIANLL